MADKSIISTDPELAALIQQEEKRQRETINLIASENYTSNAVREALASRATDKYAEGYPGKRYYAGCDIVDQIEQCAIERCKKLFGAEMANVQPHAGSQANFAAYYALLQPGQTILAMNLASGGHLTHGHPVNASGSWYHCVSYGVDPESGLINYEQVAQQADIHRPALIIAGASAYARTIDFAQFAAIARSVNARLMVDMAHIAGLVAAGVHPSPLPHADIVTSTTHKTLRGPRGGIILAKHELSDRVNRAIMPGTQGGPFMHTIAAKAVCFQEALRDDFVHYQKQVVHNAQQLARCLQALGYTIVTGGTDTHLFVIDLRTTKHTGLSAQRALAQVGITTSRSCIPNDPQSAWVTSGLRLGTAGMTTRGLTEAQIPALAACIDETLRASSPENITALAHEITRFARALLLPQ